MPKVRATEIRERRRRMGVKLRPFSEAADVSYQSLANIESGCQDPSIEVVYRLARALGCEASDLLVPQPAKTPRRRRKAASAQAGESGRAA